MVAHFSRPPQPWKLTGSGVNPADDVVPGVEVDDAVVAVVVGAALVPTRTFVAASPVIAVHAAAHTTIDAASTARRRSASARAACGSGRWSGARRTATRRCSPRSRALST